MLNQIVYLLYPTLIGRANFGAFELVDVGSAERARSLQDKGHALIVGDADVFSEYLTELRKHGDDCLIYQQFLNRVRSFPLDWRTPEWESLVARLDPVEGIPFHISVNVNNEEVSVGG